MLLTFLVLLAFVLFAVLRELELRGVEPDASGGNCPQCGATLEADWIACPACRKLLKDDCVGCGALRPVCFPYCPHCGRKGAAS